MSIDRKAAKRYASALFSAARKTGKTEAVQRDLDSLEALVSQTPELQRALESPLIPGEKKKALVAKLFQREVDPLSMSFLTLLIEKRREEILPAIGEEFRRQADDARGLIRAQAVVASELDDLQRAALVESLERRTGKQIELQVTVDVGIIGGAVVRMQDTVIDGSVRGSLERLREQMLHER